MIKQNKRVTRIDNNNNEVRSNIYNHNNNNIFSDLTDNSMYMYQCIKRA